MLFSICHHFVFDCLSTCCGIIVNLCSVQVFYYVDIIYCYVWVLQWFIFDWYHINIMCIALTFVYFAIFIMMVGYTVVYIVLVFWSIAFIVICIALAFGWIAFVICFLVCVPTVWWHSCDVLCLVLVSIHSCDSHIARNVVIDVVIIFYDIAVFVGERDALVFFACRWKLIYSGNYFVPLLCLCCVFHLCEDNSLSRILHCRQFLQLVDGTVGGMAAYLL